MDETLDIDSFDIVFEVIVITGRIESKVHSISFDFMLEFPATSVNTLLKMYILQ